MAHDRLVFGLALGFGLANQDDGLGWGLLGLGWRWVWVALALIVGVWVGRWGLGWLTLQG